MMSVAVGSALVELVCLSYRANMAVMLVGRHGVGKSEIAKQAAAALGVGYRVIDLSLCEPVDLVGLPYQRDGKTSFAPPALLPTSGAGLLVLEELNRAPRHVRAPCLQLLTARRLNEYQLPKGWVPMACVNPNRDETAEDEHATGLDYHVDELDPALLSRFLRVEVTPDAKEWIAWAKSADVHEAVCEVVKANGNDALIGGGANPRAWVYASQLLKAHDAHPSPDETLLTALVGVLDERWGTILARIYGKTANPMPPELIITELAKWKPTLQTWKKQKRVELLEATWNALQRHLMTHRVSREVVTNATYRKNVIEFVSLLPADVRRKAQAWVDEQFAAFEAQRGHG